MATPPNYPRPNPAAPKTGGLTSANFLTGLVVGGALTYVLTNENVQRALINGAAQVWLGLQGTLEETKERFRDAESEVKSSKAE